MNVSQLCGREIVSIDSDASLKQAAGLMRQQHVGALVVTRADGGARRVAGIVTDRDFAIEVIASGVDPASLHVGDLVNDRIVEVPASTDLRQCADAMARGGVRRVLVVDDDGSVVGLVSCDDVVSAIAGELDGVSTALRSGIAQEKIDRGTLPSQERRRIAASRAGALRAG